MASEPVTPPARRSRTLRIALLVVGAIIVLPIVGLTIAATAFDLGGLVRKQVLALKPEWEKEIGRGIEIGPVSVRLFPTLLVSLHDVVVQPEPARATAGGPSAEPLFKLGSVEIKIATWPLLASLGKDARISGIEVVAPSVNVVRFADGRLSYQDILERLSSEDKPPSKPMSPETLEYLAGVRLSRAAITRAALHFTDLQAAGAPATFAIDDLDVIATDVRLGAAFPIDVDAAILAPARNFHLGVVVAPVPRDLVLGPPISLVEKVALKLQPLDVAPLLRFVPPPTGIGLQGALVDADFTLETPAGAGKKLGWKGSVGARHLVLRSGAGAAGQPTDVALSADLTADPVAGDLTVPTLALTIGAMGLSGNVDARAVFSSPVIKALQLASSGITFERIAAVLPPGTMPRGATLAGPIEVRAAASGTADKAAITASIDLGGSTIVVPRALRKPAGVALRTDFQGQVQPSVIDVERLALVLGTLRVAVHGTVHPKGDFDLTLDSIKAQIDPLLRLLPEVEGAIPAGTSLAGELALEGRVKRSGGALSGDVKLQLGGAAVKTSALELLGGAGLAVKMRAAGSSDTVDATLDLGPARLMVPGKLDKAAGVPTRIALGADRAGSKITVREAALDLPGAVVRAAGTSDGAAHRLDLKVTRCDLDLAQLSRVAPLLRDKETLPPWLSDAHIQFTAALDGDPAQLGTVHARLDGLDLAAAGGHVKGFADVVGLEAPKKITFDLAGTGLDFDRILGTSPGSDKPAAKGGGGKGGDPVIPRFVKTLALDGKIRLDRGRIKGVSFANLVGDIKMDKGKGVFQALHMDMFGGQVLADGSTVDVNPNPPRFSLRTKLSNIAIGQLVAMQSPSLGQRFSGKGNLDLNLDGQGLSWASIAPQLSGVLGLAFLDGKLEAPSIGGAALGQLLGKVPGLAAAPAVAQGGELPLQNLSTRFQVVDGQLRTTSPVTLATKEGALSVAGGIGLDQRLALTGNISIPPAVIAAASGGRIKMTSALPVSLKIGGTLTAPQVEVVDLVKTAAVLASSLLAGQGAELLTGALGKQLGGAVGGAAGKVLGAGSVEGAAAEAQKALAAEAQKRLGDEQARIQQQIQQKIQQEAAARLQQEAQNKIADEARKRLGSGLGGLFGN